MHSAWILAGATATGKSSVCQHLAECMDLKILSADSMLVYQGMDIGTAKPSSRERGEVPYLGIDLVTPDQPFSTGAWVRSIRGALRSAEPSSDKPLIVTGGTGLYIKALTNGLDSKVADLETRDRWREHFEEDGIERLRYELKTRMPKCPQVLADSTNPRHLIRALEHLETSGCLPDNWQQSDAPAIIALSMPREQLHARILRRVENMFDQGLLDEVRRLKELYPVWSQTASKAIGYAEARALLEGATTREEAIEQICARTRQLAKRQETWFKHQHNTIWCSIKDQDCVGSIAEKVLCLWHKHGTIKLKI